MIIRCQACKTRFRFDDTLMTGEGVWVRCGRCQQVFFQDNPDYEVRVEEKPPEAVPAVEPIAVVSSETQKEEMVAVEDQNQATIAGKDVEPILAHVQEIRKAMEDEKHFGLAYKEFEQDEGVPPGDDELSEDDEFVGPTTAAKGTQRKPARKKRSFLKALGYALLCLLALALLGGGYFWAFPQDRRAAIDFAATYIPFVGQLGKDLGLTDQGTAQVAFQDVRQRFVSNWLMGNLRVLEGTVVNEAKYPLTRIQVRGKLYDAAGIILGEKVSFCGNILSDADLASLMEEEIQNRLSQPLGNTGATDRISPNGRIPFMIVFVHEPPTVAKATVLAAGAERLVD